MSSTSKLHAAPRFAAEDAARSEADRGLPSLPAGSRTLALLPGSRRQEVREILPAQLRVAAALQRDDASFVPVVSCQRPALRAEVERRIAAGPTAARIHEGPVHDLQRSADLALVCSGTATLEQAWYGTPMVVLYAASEVERALYRGLSVAPHFALVNLFAGREVVPEVLFTPGDEEAVIRRARPLVAGPVRERVERDLAALRADRFHLGAAERAADEIVTFLGERLGRGEPRSEGS